MNCSPRLYRFALRLARDPTAAEDLAQEALLRAWRGRARLRDERAARGWLFQIVVNLWRDRLRHRATSEEELAEPSAVVCPDQPLRALEERELVDEALAALDELPQRQREVLYLHACEGLSIAEVAQALETSPDAVKASLCLARKRMRARLGHLFPEGPWTGTPTATNSTPVCSTCSRRPNGPRSRRTWQVARRAAAVCTCSGTSIGCWPARAERTRSRHRRLR